MPYYSRIILNSFYNRLFPKLFRHNRRMPKGHINFRIVHSMQLCQQLQSVYVLQVSFAIRTSGNVRFFLVITTQPQFITTSLTHYGSYRIVVPFALLTQNTIKK